MSKKRIVVPPTVLVRILTQNGPVVEPVPMSQLVIDTLLQDRRFSIDRRSMRLGDEIEDMFRDAQPGKVIDMPETHHRILAAVADKPQFGQKGELGFQPIIRQMLSYLDAICDAKSVPSVEPTPE